MKTVYLITASAFGLVAATGAEAQATGSSMQMPTSDSTRAAVSTDQPRSQAAAPPAGPTTQDIVVTAQKRAQSLSDVGEAITAATGEQLKLIGIFDVAGLTKLDPSFVVANANYGQPVYSIRGISYNDYALAASPVVSVYSDEVPYAYPALTKGATYDLERVEVLKGPQGTLYGQNSTGGAINYISAKPTSVLAAGIEGTYGSFNAVNVQGYVSGPITDGLKARLAFDVDGGGAWQRSTTRDATLGRRDSQKARLLVDWKPAPGLTISLNANGWIDRSDSRAGQFVTLVPQVPSYLSAFPVLLAAKAPGADDRAADWDATIRPRLDEHYYQFSGRVEYQLAKNTTLTYLGSYEHYTQNDLLAPTGTAAPVNYLFGGKVESDSQELRLSGTLVDGRLNWLLGGDYERNITSEAQVFNLAGGTTSYAYVAQRLATTPYSGFTNISHDDSRSKAGFVNVDFKATDTLTVHGGARFTQTDIDHGGCTLTNSSGVSAVNAYEKALIGLHPGTGPYVPVAAGQCSTLGPQLTPVYARGSLDQNNVSWRAAVDWKPFRGTLLYASASQGYKAGNFPTQAATTYLQLVSVVQESLRAYEIGGKSRFLNGRLNVDFAAFHYDYRNKQLEGRVPDPLFTAFNVPVNIPKSYENGVELSVKAEPIPGLDLSLQGTYLYSRIQGSTPGYDGFGVKTNYEGDSFPDAPRLSITPDAQYSFGLNDKYTAFIGARVQYRTSTQSQLGTYGYSSGAFSVATTELPRYALLGLRAGVLSRDRRRRFEVFGENVTNTYYWTQELKQSDSVVRYTGMPATFGITVAYHY